MPLTVATLLRALAPRRDISPVVGLMLPDVLRWTFNADQPRGPNGKWIAGVGKIDEAREAYHLSAFLKSHSQKIADIKASTKGLGKDAVKASKMTIDAMNKSLTWNGHTGIADIKGHLATLQQTARQGAEHLKPEDIAQIKAAYKEAKATLGDPKATEEEREASLHETRVLKGHIAQYNASLKAAGGKPVGMKEDAPKAAKSTPAKASGGKQVADEAKSAKREPSHAQEVPTRATGKSIEAQRDLWNAERTLAEPKVQEAQLRSQGKHEEADIIAQRAAIDTNVYQQSIPFFRSDAVKAAAALSKDEAISLRDQYRAMAQALQSGKVSENQAEDIKDEMELLRRSLATYQQITQGNKSRSVAFSPTLPPRTAAANARTLTENEIKELTQRVQDRQAYAFSTEAVERIRSSAAFQAVLTHPEILNGNYGETFQYDAQGNLIAGTAIAANGDQFMTQYAHETGLDGIPRQVSTAEVDRLVANGAQELWRGDSREKYRDEFMTGPYHVGLGVGLNGTYFARGSRDSGAAALAKSYATMRVNEGRPPGVVSRMVLAPDASTIRRSDLEVQQAASIRLFVHDHADHLSPPEIDLMLKLFADTGRYAMLRGLDAITFDSMVDGAVTVVLNRGQLIAQQDAVDLASIPDGEPL